MKSNKINKKVYFWVTGEKFDDNNVNRIYDEMKYNFYLPSDLANGLSEYDYGAITDVDSDKAKEFARRKLRELNINNPFCYLIEKEFTFSTNEWKILTDNEGNINLSKFGMNEFPEFEEPIYSIYKDSKIEKEQENAIHIKPPEIIDSAILDLVTSDYNTEFRLLNKLYTFSERNNMFDNLTDLEKLNRVIQQKNQNNLTKVQRLDKLGRALEGVIPLKIICYMIADTKLIFCNTKEYSSKDIEENKKENEEKIKNFENEKEQLIREVKDFSRKIGLNIENIFDKNGKLLDRKLTIDNPEFEKEARNLEIELAVSNQRKKKEKNRVSANEEIEAKQ